MKPLFPLLLSLLSLFACARQTLTTPHADKREFRGAWIQAVNGQFQGLGRDAMQRTLTLQLDELQRAGINCILFQVRPEGDALYPSHLEPWSRFLTGQQGLRPSPYWDPLQWMIDQAHRRGMELHAWINPFRGKTKNTDALTSPYYRQHPDRFFTYDGLLIFDPAIPENRAYICHVAADIARRYDIDGLHIDDYFYPYPVAGIAIPDDASYQRYGRGRDRGDWRRENVDRFMKAMHDTLRAVKPWVKFGVSPFGIYRNKTNGHDGSDTHGLQNYDDLYADVLRWVDEGWVDYNIPQLYWEIGNRAADYQTLVEWWGTHATGRPLYIGQDVERTVKFPDTNHPTRHQIYQKYDLQRRYAQGSCQWYAKAVVDNPHNYTTALRQTYHRHPALQPEMPWIDSEAPGKPRKVKALWLADGYHLFWTAPKAKTEMDRATRYVVYRFRKGETLDTGDPAHIVAITSETQIRLPYHDGRTKYTYLVSALDRLQNESRTTKKTVKL